MGAEHKKPSAVAKLQDDDRMEHELTAEWVRKLDGDLRCILTEKLGGVEPGGMFKGLHDGDGFAAQRKIYTWCSEVAGVALLVR